MKKNIFVRALDEMGRIQIPAAILNMRQVGVGYEMEVSSVGNGGIMLAPHKDIVEEQHKIQELTVLLDADLAGHLLTVCAEHRNKLMKQIEDELVKPQEDISEIMKMIADEVYFIGHYERAIHTETLTNSELLTIENWEMEDADEAIQELKRVTLTFAEGLPEERKAKIMEQIYTVVSDELCLPNMLIVEARS